MRASSLHPVNIPNNKYLNVRHQSHHLRAVQPSLPPTRHILSRNTTLNSRLNVPRQAILLVRRSRLSTNQNTYQAPHLIRRRRNRRPRRLQLQRRLRRRTPRTGHLTNRIFTNRFVTRQNQMAFIRRRMGRPRSAIRTLKRLNRKQRLVKSPNITSLNLNPRSSLNGNNQHNGGNTNGFFNNRITSFARHRQRLHVNNRYQIAANRSRTRTVILRILSAPLHLFRHFRLHRRIHLKHNGPNAPTRTISNLRTPNKRRPNPQVIQRSIPLPTLSHSRRNFLRHLFNRVRVPRRAGRNNRSAPQIITMSHLSRHLSHLIQRRSNVPLIAETSDQSEL